VPNDLTAAPMDLHWLTIADAARLIERRPLSPVELTGTLMVRAPNGLRDVPPWARIKCRPFDQAHASAIIVCTRATRSESRRMLGGLRRCCTSSICR
jgi:hypothetical protein